MLFFASALCTVVVACSDGDVPRDGPDRERPEREGYLTGAEDARIHYRVLGSGADTVVVIHGGPGAGMHSVLPAFEPLSDRFTLVFYDQRGGGRSELPADTSLLRAKYFVEDLEAVRRHFELQELKLVAHSFGGILAARYAMEHPRRVARMVFHSATGPVRSQAARIARSSPPSPDTALSRRASELLRALLEGTASDPVETCRAWEEINRRLAEARGDTVAWNGTSCAMPPDAVRYYFRHTAQFAPRTFGDWDFTSGLEHVSAPLLVVAAGRDSLTIAAQRAWAAAVPNGRLLIVPGEGAAVTDRPQVVLPAITSFLRGRWPEEATPVERSPLEEATPVE